MTQTEMAEANKRRDDAILRFIYAHRVQHGYPPALMEIGEHFGMSRSMAFDAVARLQERGLVVRGKRQSSRAMTITPAGLAALGLTEEAAATGMQLVPVLHSTQALQQWLKTASSGERVPPARALAGKTVDIWTV